MNIPEIPEQIPEQFHSISYKEIIEEKFIEETAQIVVTTEIPLGKADHIRVKNYYPLKTNYVDDY